MIKSPKCSKRSIWLPERFLQGALPLHTSQFPARSQLAQGDVQAVSDLALTSTHFGLRFARSFLVHVHAPLLFPLSLTMCSHRHTTFPLMAQMKRSIRPSRTQVSLIQALLTLPCVLVLVVSLAPAMVSLARARLLAPRVSRSPFPRTAYFTHDQCCRHQAATPRAY